MNTVVTFRHVSATHDDQLIIDDLLHKLHPYHVNLVIDVMSTTCSPNTPMYLRFNVFSDAESN